MKTMLLAAAAAVTTVALPAQTAIKYQTPPAPIEKLVSAKPLPVASTSPDRKLLLIEQPATFPTIAEVAEPRLRLAGLRFNPDSASPSVDSYVVGLSFQPLDGGPARKISGLPTPLKVSDILWAPDSRHIAIVQRNEKSARSAAGLKLWVIDVTTAAARPLAPAMRLNNVLDSTPCEWLPTSAALACKIVPLERGPAPKLSEVPTGPHVSENLGKATPAPTYEDMLSTPDDEDQFAYYATAQLAIIPLTGAAHALPIKGILDQLAISPDGRFALTSIVHRPFSYTVPYERFPLLTEVVTLKTGTVTKLNDRPVIDNLPIVRDTVAPGPRGYEWRADAPATIVFTEAADGGDPRTKAEIRDRVKMLAAPFTGEATTLLELPMRPAGYRGGSIRWGNDHYAVVSVSRWADRKTALLSFDPSSTGPAKLHTLYEGSSQDRYHSPGAPMLVPNAAGKRVLAFTPDGSALYFVSQGATPKGDQPFVATLPLNGGEETILTRSADPFYTEPITLLGGDRLLVRRESQNDPPNYFVTNLRGRVAPIAVTHFPSPYEGIALPTRQLLRYKRSDGVDLNAVLWTPAGYDKSQGPLPTLMEAYPAEFKTRAAASQTSGSTNRFPTFGWGSPVFFTQTGYAVLQNTSIPIIGEGKEHPNDTYVEQLVASAKAAIDYASSLGVVDRTRVGVMGHSYGAFMTANLLAHSDLFRAGIARSGAYNRSLTPYGFQNEDRTYWQAPKVYYEMSPFSYADKIKTPILLIHGEADDNTGTFPIQSERFYAALKGQGATVRLVFLPLEPHHYGAKESVDHMLWEMSRWLDTYVKPKEPVTAAK
ncbi:MAG: prolyl oligopeptidase family serine peptidase [Acidobacteriaceae bacterium]|nr:prolyl oligopeptidase family serine peptidase [Acidobacteriaceae bacterium]